MFIFIGGGGEGGGEGGGGESGGEGGGRKYAQISHPL